MTSSHNGLHPMDPKPIEANVHFPYISAIASMHELAINVRNVYIRQNTTMEEPSSRETHVSRTSAALTQTLSSTRNGHLPDSCKNCWFLPDWYAGQVS
jgi:hypothetical protein